MKQNNSKKPKSTKIDYVKKLRRMGLGESEEASKILQNDKIESKQIVSSKNDLNSCDILYLEGAKLKNFISQLQENIVKRNISSKDKNAKVKDCIATMAKFYQIEKNQISYSDGNTIRTFADKFTYTGFLVKQEPQGYGKQCDEYGTYKGYFYNGKRHDEKGTLITSGYEKYIGGFSMDKFHGFAEIYRKEQYQTEIELDWLKYLEGEYRDGKLNGHATQFLSPKDKSEGVYIDGKQHGFWKYYEMDATNNWVLRRTETYNNNIIEGYQKCYDYRNGKLIRIFYPSYDGFNKTDIRFENSGEIFHMQFNYEEFTTAFYQKNHNYIHEDMYGRQIFQDLAQNIKNTIKYRSIWFENLREQISICYYPDGNLSNFGAKYQGYKDGYNICYDRNTGQKSKEGYFKQNRLEGYGKIYYDSGELMFEGNFKEGQHHGEVIEYYRNGQILSVGQYKRGDRKYMRFYDENGNLLEEGGYKNGLRHSTLKIYNENVLVEEIRYFTGTRCQYDSNNSSENICECPICAQIEVSQNLKERMQNDLQTLNDRINEACNDRNEWNGKIMTVSDILQKRTSTRKMPPSPIRELSEEELEAPNDDNDSLYSIDDF